MSDDEIKVDNAEISQELEKDDNALQGQAVATSGVSDGVAVVDDGNKSWFYRHTTGFRNYFDNLKGGLSRFKQADGKTKTTMASNAILNKGLLIALLIFVIFVASIKPRFLSIGNIVDILNESSINLILALGVASIIVIQGTDLSSGVLMQLSAAICLSLLQRLDLSTAKFPGLHLPIIVPLLISILVAAIIGFLNGFFVAKFKLHPFIVTLGTYLIVIGLGFWYLSQGQGGVELYSPREDYQDLIKGGIDFTKLLGSNTNVIIMWVVFYALIISIIMWVVWNKTKFGKNIFAVGCNPDAASVNGISVFWTTVLVFVMGGVLYAIAGFLYAGYNTSIKVPAMGDELTAITACVVGGVSFSGGIGKIKGVAFGVILLTIINVALRVLSIPDTYVNLAKGAIILFAVVIDVRKYRVKR